MNPLIKQIDATAPRPATIALWWIGQEGYVLKTPRLTAYLDPYLSTFAERVTQGQANEHIRMTPPPMRPEEVTNADIVLCTHDHADHIDPDGLPLIAQVSPRAQFVVPEAALPTLLKMDIARDRIHTLRGDDRLALPGLEVHAVPAKHERFDQTPEHGYPYLSYVIRFEGLTLLHAGDTIPYEGQVEKVRPFGVDLALLPINGRDEFRHKLQFEGNFTCEEAVAFALQIGAKLTIPMHYDMFSLNTADVKDFRRAAEARNVSYRVLNVGKLFVFPEKVKP